MYTFLIVLILLLPIPLYIGFKAFFDSRHNRRNALILKRALDRVIKRNRLSISEIDSFGNKAIALDLKKNKLILVEHRNNVTWETCLSLGELSSFEILKKMDQLTGCTQKIVIEFNFNSKEDLVHFTFYDASNDNIHELPSRVKKATCWKKMIQHQLNGVKASRRPEYVF
jgi:hypothetical protein